MKSLVKPIASARRIRRARSVTFALGVGLALVLAAGASARTWNGEAPPTNDDRAQALAISAFPAAIDGTTAGATVERLDPQRSQCGTVESTVWYRIDKAPDGTISVGVQGAGLAPVVRVYAATKSGIDELRCASANPGKRAATSWETIRGNSYLVLVGKKSGTADAAFAFGAQLFLPPANDAARHAGKLAVPGQLTVTTLGATADEGDPRACGLAGGTVWYSIKPGRASRVVVRVHAARNLDAAAVVVRKVRSETRPVTCEPTDSSGNAQLVWDVEKRATYLLAVGQRRGSPPGDLSVKSFAAEPREIAPGRRLPAAGGRASLNGLTNVNDIWWTTLAAGTTYRIAFSSDGCAALTMSSRRGVVRSFECSGYTTLTPAPDAAGKYVFEVTAPQGNGSMRYRLLVAAAARDDVGVGMELANLKTVRGSLSPSAGDVVDLYHFDVQRRSDVRVRLDSAGAFSLTLVTYEGRLLGSSSREIGRDLSADHYVVAVRAPAGSRAGPYRLSLVIRDVTTTALRLSAPEVAPGIPVTFNVAVTPLTAGGAIRLAIERFDPLGGWQFNRAITLLAPTASYRWMPPAPGRWRAQAAYLGTLRSSPSRTGYSTILVAKPLSPGTRKP